MLPPISVIARHARGAPVALCVGLILSACSYNPIGVPIDVADASPGPADSPPAEPDAALVDDVVHVPAVGEFATSASLRLSNGDTIDTTSLTIAGQDPADGVVFDVHPHDGGGPELAILHVSNLDIPPGAVVKATGSRPLVIIAGQRIVVAGTLDASADLDVPGPGGFGPRDGPGAGGTGLHAGAVADGGGGGGGFGQPGGEGGRALCVCPTPALGGDPGPAYGDAALTVLQGGSGGGDPGDACVGLQPPPGAGGGAIQLYAGISIQLDATGGIHAGGGGGGKGIDCTNWGAGSGGGSGGAIFLQAPLILHDGLLAANGGGGGSSAGSPSGDIDVGEDGEDGEDGRFAVMPAQGGADIGRWAQEGGVGGYGSEPAEDGDDETSDTGGNGGGGGGGVGRIVFLTRDGSPGAGQTSPPAFESVY